MMGLSDGRKKFQIGLAVLIQYRRVTDTQAATQLDTQTGCRSKDTAYYVARVKTSHFSHQRSLATELITF